MKTKAIRNLAVAGLVLGLFAGLSLVGSGCAQDVGEIDRTQIDLLNKRDLEGEWYVRHTTVDAPYASFFTFEGDQSPMERGYFEITEGYLVFYRTYEFSQNSQTIGLKSDTDKPYLSWLEGDAAIWTPNPYQARNLRFAQGDVLPLKDNSAAEVACDGRKPAEETGGMHEFCREQTGNHYAYCGHPADMVHGDRTHANAVCVSPTKYVFSGAPLAAYPIEDHVDIQYTYNPTTGEKTNVVEENSSDRYWYEREYIRVDWGTNDVTNYQYTLFSITKKTVTDVSGDDVDINGKVWFSNFEGDAAPEEDKFRIFREEDGTAEYFDFSTRYVLQAPTMYYEYWDQQIPICVFYPYYLGGVFECSSEEVKTRTGFMKVDPDDDYVPEQYDDHVMDKFGYFRQERLSYDELYYDTYDGVIRHIQRWDLWDSHPVKDDGTVDYAAATPVPVVYYLSEDFPRDQVPVANALAAQWSKPFDEVVAFYKGADGVPASGMFVVCENNNDAAQEALEQGQPTAVYGSDLCKDMGYVKRNGDLRYSYLYAVNAPSDNGLLGYGPSSADPLTGKIISASAYVYMANLRLSVNRAADVVELMAGYLDYPALALATDISNAAYPAQVAVNGNPPPGSEADAQDLVRGMVSGKVRSRLTKFGLDKTDTDWARMRMSMVKNDPELDKMMIFPDFRVLLRDPAALEGDLALTDQQYERMALRNWANHRGFSVERNRLMEFAKHTLYRTEFADGALLAMARKWQARFDNEICSAVADEMGNGVELAFDLDHFDVVKEACLGSQAGQLRPADDAPSFQGLKEEYDPNVPAPGDTCMYLDQGGLQGYYWVNTCTVRKLASQIAHAIQFGENMDQEEHWKPSAWWADTSEPVVAASQKFVRAAGDAIREDMIKDFSQQMYFSVALHGVGHTLGLRHNFEASTDAMNYPKKYWEYKVALSANKESWLPVDLWGQETGFQSDNGMREHQYASIMDYGSKFNGLWKGLGLYDHAAIKFGYGGIVEVFKNTPDLAKWEKYLQDPAESGGKGESAPVRVDSDRLETLFKRVHYSQIPNVLGSPEAIYDREDVLFSELKGAACTTDADCGAGGGCKGCTECRVQLNGKYCAPPNRMEVPYRFCGDEYATRTPTCDIWDEGADPYEIVRNSADDYWWYWPLWGRWRGSIRFHPIVYSNRVMWTFNRMKRQFQWWAVNYMRFNKDDWWEKNVGDGVPWEESLNGGLAGAMATREAFNTLLSVFAIPASYGSVIYSQVYAFNKSADRYEPSSSFNYYDLSKRFIIEEDYGKFSGRPMYGGLTFMGDDVLFTSGGGIYDRVNAFTALTDPTTDFLNIEEFSDARKYLISFYTFFPDKMISLLGGLTTQRHENFAACVVEDDGGYPWYLRLRDMRTADDPNFCSDGKFLYPEEVDYDFSTTWFRIPLLAAYFGMSLMINDYDRRFMDATRVFLKGHEDAVELPAGAEIVEFADPMTGKVYVAYKQGEDDKVDIAYFLVNRCNEILAGYDSLEDLQADYVGGTSEMQRVVSLLELIRGLHKQYDYQSYGDLVFSTDDGY